jgi:hypothetical protein
LLEPVLLLETSAIVNVKGSPGQTPNMWYVAPGFTLAFCWHLLWHSPSL